MGAIFGYRANIIVSNSTFTGNAVARGVAGGNGAHNGSDAGGAIFTVGGSLTVVNSTIAGNESTGEGAGLAVYKPTTGEGASLSLTNTIIAGNTGRDECFVLGGVSMSGWNNLVTPHPLDAHARRARGSPRPAIRLLAPLTLAWPGRTPTMALNAASPAIDAGDPVLAPPDDQRGVARPAVRWFRHRGIRVRWPVRHDPTCGRPDDSTGAECERMDQQPSHGDVELGRRSGWLGNRSGQLHDVIIHDRRGTRDRADRRDAPTLPATSARPRRRSTWI